VNGVHSVDLTAEAASVPAAREFVRAQSHDVAPELREILELCVSELATNCVLHARTSFTIRYLDQPACVRIEVSDTGAGMPVVQQPSRTDRHGRGLQVVSGLADNWGVHAATQSPGKTVWFEFRLPYLAR
jgi:anti-sigma regulatory factor (Ser/Thr protein kinase)